LSKVQPAEDQEVVKTLVQSPKGAEVQESKDAAKEHKEKRKKRKEAGKGDFSDPTSDGGSARCPTLGAQVANGDPAAAEEEAGENVGKFPMAAHGPDGTDTVTTETCGSVTSEGLLSCAQAYGTAWEPAAEEPCGSDGTETLTEQAWLCQHDQQEQSKDSPRSLPPCDAGACANENRSIPTDLDPLASAWLAGQGQQAAPVMFDLAAADGEVPALAAEFTAQLSEVDLGNFAEPLARLGVEAARDVAYISDKELGRMGMRLVQRRKLRAMVPSGQGEEDGEEILEEGTIKPYVDSATDGSSGCQSEVSTTDAASNEAEANALGTPTKLEVEA
jgi:hypothetical protein